MNVPRKLNNFQHSRVVFLLGLFLLAFLAVRFQVGITKFFDADEYAHLHAAWLWAKGEAPYQDFFYFYSPAMMILLRPLLIFGESPTTLLAARALMWLIAIAGIGLTYLLGKALRNTLTGVLAALILAVLPIGLEKAVEVRPDNLAVLLYLAGLLLAVLGLRQRSHKKLVASGVMFGLAAVVTMKMVFGILGLGVSFLFLTFKSGKRMFRSGVWWGIGFAGTFLVLVLTLLALGVISEGIYSIFRLPREVFSAYGWYYYAPQGVFYPDPALFGMAGRSLPWLVNFLIWIAGLSWLVALGVGRGLGKAKDRQELIFFVGPATVFFGFAILAYYNITLLQYFLPLLPLIGLTSADFLAMALAWLGQRFRPAAYVVLSVVVVALGVSLWQVAQPKIAWGDRGQLALVKDILSISQPTDTFFDMTGKYLFRPDAYFACCAVFPEFRNNLSRPLPDLINSLIANQNKFVIGGGRLTTLSPEERQFIEANYLPLYDVLRGETVEPGYSAANDKILVSGKRIAVADSAEFFLIAEGPYQVFWQPESLTQITLDGKLLGPGSYVFSQGDHQVLAAGPIVLTIVYDYEQAKERGE